MSQFNGKNLTIEILGESHSEFISANVKGFPQIKVNLSELDEFLSRRKASKKSFSTSRKESDTPIFEGIENGKINGEFKVKILNENKRSNDYDNLIGKPRPSHADYAWYLKDGQTNFSGGGRFSGRLTAPLCVVGGIAKQYLKELGIYIHAYIRSIGNVVGKSYKNQTIEKDQFNLSDYKEFPALGNSEQMLDEIIKAKQGGDSLGGVIECIVYGMKKGVGDNLFSGLEGKISSLVYSIPAVKGVEFGDGFDITNKLGSEANDPLVFKNDQVCFLKNSSGGINGGISNGESITLSVAFRPTPSISKEQQTVDLINKTNTKIVIGGRHDSCIVPRAVPCVESAVAIAILDEIL